MKAFFATIFLFISVFPQAEAREFCSLEGTTGGIEEPITDFLHVPKAFWGNGRSAMGDTNGDDLPDFCRVIYDTKPGTPSRGRLACTRSVGRQFADTMRGSTICSDIVELRNSVNVTDAWIDFDGDGRMDYCTDLIRVSRGRQSRYIKCYLSRGDKFEATEAVPTSYDSGVSKWVDFDGDGKADYCEEKNADKPGGQLAEISCHLSGGKKFVDQPVVKSLKYRPLNEVRDFIDINGDDKSDFCSVIKQAGKNLIVCHLSDGHSFSDPRIEPLD